MNDNEICLLYMNVCVFIAIAMFINISFSLYIVFCVLYIYFSVCNGIRRVLFAYSYSRNGTAKITSPSGNLFLDILYTHANTHIPLYIGILLFRRLKFGCFFSIERLLCRTPAQMYWMHIPLHTSERETTVEYLPYEGQYYFYYIFDDISLEMSRTRFHWHSQHSVYHHHHNQRAFLLRRFSSLFRTSCFSFIHNLVFSSCRFFSK